jgi:hypothetical protein
MQSAPCSWGIYAGHMFSQGSTQSKTTHKVALNYRNDIETLFLKHKLLPLATAVTFHSLFCHIPTTLFPYLSTPEPAFPETPLHYQRHSSTHISFPIATPQTKARSHYGSPFVWERCKYSVVYTFFTIFSFSRSRKRCKLALHL